MENFGGQASYVKRLTRVTSYIYDHLDDDLDLQNLAEVAALSPYHWHRVYHAIYGETVAATVKRLRLQRASVTAVPARGTRWLRCLGRRHRSPSFWQTSCWT